jgi:hypothetical protein
MRRCKKKVKKRVTTNGRSDSRRSKSERRNSLISKPTRAMDEIDGNAQAGSALTRKLGKVSTQGHAPEQTFEHACQHERNLQSPWRRISMAAWL